MSWLARKVVLRPHSDPTLWVVTFLSVTCLTLLAFATVAVPVVASRVDARVDAVTPRLDHTSSTRANPSQLRVLEPEVVNLRRWNGHRVTRDFYSPSTSDLVAPGVDRMPRPHQYFASPDLITLMAKDETIAKLFRGQEQLGSIRPDGLSQPHELRAIAGITPTHVLMANVTGFGASNDPSAPVQQRQEHTRLRVVVAAFVLAMVWIPALFLLLVVARLSSTQRHRRTRAMRLIGMSRGAVITFHAVETAVVAVPAALSASVIYLSASHHLTRIPATSLGFYPSDLALPTWGFALLALAPAATCCFASALDVEPEALTARPGSGRARQQFGLALAIAGALMLAIAPLLVDSVGFVAAAGLWLGCTFLATGLALVAPSIAIIVLRRCGRRTTSAEALVGSRLATHGVSTSVRLSSLLAVIVVLMLGGTAFTSVLNGGESQEWRERVAAQPYVPTIVSDLAGTLTRSTMQRIDPSLAVAQVTTLRAGNTQVGAVIATCADLTGLIGRTPEQCTDQPQWVSAPRPVAGKTLTLPGGARIPAPGHDEVTLARGVPSAFIGSVLLSPSTVDGSTFSDGSQFYLLPRSGALMSTVAAISSATPSGQIDLGALDRHNPDTQDFPTEIGLLTTGALAGLLIGAVALLAAAAGETRERSERFRPLRLIGASRRQLFAAHMWATVAAPATLTLVAVFFGWYAVASMHRFDNRAVVGAGLLGETLVTCLATCFIVGVATWPGVTRASRRSGGFEG